MTIISRVKQRFLENAVAGQHALHRMERSWDIRKSVRRFRKHDWILRDLQYLLVAINLIFCIAVIRDPPLIARLAVAGLLGLAILVPISSQFFLPALPVFSWLMLFYASSFIGAEYRPVIFVRVLPAWETILYGGNLSEVLSKSQNSALDILAWIPYGLVHYAAPFIFAFVFFIFGPPSTLPCFGFAFGWMNFTAVMTQLCFPTAPPWYLEEYGLDPASYNVHGSPAGLARVDKLLGLNMYTGTFNASPLVFGAFPSLHSGFAVMQVLFLCHLFPNWAPLFLSYILWIWWATMYLSHHYFIDLIAGACLAFVIFYLVRMTILPNVQPGKFSRWSYDYIERGLTVKQAKFRKSVDDTEYIELPVVDTEGQMAQLQKSFPMTGTNHHHHHHTSSLHLHTSDSNSFKPKYNGNNSNNKEDDIRRAHFFNGSDNYTPSRTSSPQPLSPQIVSPRHISSSSESTDSS